MSTASARTLDTDVTPTKTKASALEKTRAAQWTLPQVVQQSLNPTVSAAEAADYARWVRHPRNLALVVPSGPVSPSAFLDDEDMIYAAAEYHEYLHGAWQSGVGLLATATTAGAGAVPTGRDEYEQGQQSQHEEYAGYADLLRLGENPLTVTEGDALKKRYKAYRKWIGGKSFFKQQPVD